VDFDPIRRFARGRASIPAPIHRELLIRERKLHGPRHRLSGRGETLHGGDLAIDPRRESMDEITHSMGVDAHGTTISTRPPTCTRAVSRRARGLTRTANGSLELRVSNSDNCVPCGFIAPNHTRFADGGARAQW